MATSTVHAAGFTINVTDSGSNHISLACTMSIVSLAITDPNQLEDGFVNVAYSYTPTATGASGSVTWSLLNGGLPAGLSLNSSTGEISGTPAAQGNFSFTVSAADSIGTVNRFFNFQVFGVGFTGSGDLGNYNQGSSVNATLYGAGGTGPYTFSAGGLPPGVSLSSSGQLSGTVTSGNGTYRFGVMVTDHNGSSYNKTFALNVIGMPTLPNLNYPNPGADSALGEAQNYPFNISGGKSPYTWSISVGSLPPGMRLLSNNLPTSFNEGPDDAVVLGAPTQLGAFNFTVSVTDSSTPPVTVSRPMTINVKAMTLNFPNSNPTVGLPYSFYLQPVGGSTPYSWSIASGNLPNGLSLNTSTGVFSGTPLEDGNFNVLVTVSGGGISINRYLTFNVNSATSPQISINTSTALPDGVVNNQYNYFFNACCAPNGVTFSVVGSLPTGLNLNSNGQLSGTPTVAKQYTIEIQATDNSNSSNFGRRFLTLNISPLQPTTPMPNGTASSSYSTTFTASGGTGTLTWALGPGSQIPPGLSLSSNGTLSGTPSSPGSYNLNYTVTDGSGNSFTGYFGMQIYAAGSVSPPNITFGNNLGAWSIGQLQYALTANGGNGTYVWSLAGGALPPGLAMRTDVPSFFPAGTAAGLIGLATTPGNYSFTLAVTSGGQTSYQYCTMRITALLLKENQLPQAFIGAAYSYTLTALNPAGTVTWTANGSMPSGLNLSSSGVLSGTPTQAGNFNINFNFTDGVDTVNRGLNLNVSALQFTNAGLLPNGQQNSAYNVTFNATGGTAPYTYSLQNSAPSGLSLNNGTLSGTLNQGTGNFSFNVQVTDSRSNSYVKTFSIDIVNPSSVLPSIALNQMVYNIASLGSFFSQNVSAYNGGTAPFTWNVTGLPQGLSARTYEVSARPNMAPDDVEVWGTPTALGTYNVQYTVTDANGVSSTVQCPLVVSAITPDYASQLPNGTIGVAYPASKLRVLGGTGPYTVSQFNVSYNPLPDGLTLNTGTFTVSGTPQENGYFYPIFQFADSAGNSIQMPLGFYIAGGASSTISINQNDNLGSITVGFNYSMQFNACCTSSGLYTWTQPGGTLPPGLTLTAGGKLSGTPTAPGTYTFLLQAADSTNLPNVGLRQFVLNVTTLSLPAPNMPSGTVNVPYSTQLSASGGTGALTFTLGLNSTLPPGITLNSTTGVLSGTPTSTGIYGFNVIFADTAGHTISGNYGLSIFGANGPPLVITVNQNLGTFSLGPIQIPLTATGGTGGYTWSITSGSLPAGLVLRTDGMPSYFPTGTTAGIVGVGTAAATGASFTIKVTDSSSNTASLICNMSVSPLIVTEPLQLNDGFVNLSYSYTLTTSGASGGVTWSVNNGNSLPQGLSLSSAGQISGTPTSQGNYNFNLTATDAHGSVGRQFNIQVWAVGLNGSADLGNVLQGAAFNTTLTGAGGTPAYTFSAGNLPPGLSLSPAGQLSGTVTAGIGTYRFNVTITDHTGGSYSKQFALDIVSTPTLPNLGYPNPPEDVTLGEPRNYSFSVNGGKSPYTWSITGSLPPGMRLATANLPNNLNVGPDDAVIWGSPTQLGTFNFTINVKDSSPTPVTVSQPMILNVQAMTNDFPPGPTRGTPYSYYVRPIGGAPPYTWTILSGNLPTGLTLNSTTGIVSGMPLDDANFGITVKIAGSGLSVTRNLGFNVSSPTNPPISMNSQTALPDVTVNNQYNFFFNACCGAGGLTYSLVGSAPPGLTLSGNGQLTGTATTIGKYTLEVQAVDGANSSNYGIRHFTLNVTPLNPNLQTPNGTAGSTYSTTLSATGGTGTLQWVLGPGSQLPPGLTLSSNGTLSGTPSSPGSYNLNYTVTDGAGNSFTGSFGMQIEAAGTSAAPSFNFGGNFGAWPLGEVQYALGASGGNGTYTWSLTGGSLPPGLAIRTDTPSFFQSNAQAGIIGLATTPGNYTFTLALTSGGQTSYQYCTWTITALTVKDSGLPQAFIGVPYSYTFTALNPAVNGTVTWTQNGGSLPAGLTFSSSGVLSGTPTQSGTFNFNYLVSDGVDMIGRGSGINVSAVRFTTDGLLQNVPQNGTVNVTFAAAGGTGGYTFTGNGLPGGLTLSQSGTLSGAINSSTGKNGFSVTVTDSSSESYTQQFSIDVIGAPPLLPSINLNGLIYNPTASLGQTFSQLVSVFFGGTAPFTWNVTGLPPGVSARPYNAAGRNDIAPDDIEIWGNPTTLGTYTVTYKVTDATGLSATVTSPFTVSALIVDNGDNLPNGTLGATYSRKLRVLGGTGPYTVSQVNTVSNPLPDGLTLNTGAFTVTGTPLETGNFNPLLQFKDSANNSLIAFYGFNVFSGTSASININTYFNLGYVVTGSSYSNQLFACCSNSGTYTWTLAGGTLPAGLTFSATGALSGTATTSGVYYFLAKAADSANLSNAGYKQFVLTVSPLVLASNTNLPYGTVNSSYSYQTNTSGSTGTVTYTLGLQGPLPPGITLSGSGLLSGTPTATGQFLFNVNIFDTSGHTDVAYFNLGIYTTSPFLAINTGANLGTLPVGEVEQPLIVAGGNGIFTWSLTSGSLPPGLSLRTDLPPYFPFNASAGIVGVATVAQSTPYQFTLTATSAGQTASQTFSLKITGLTAMENTGFRLPDAFLGTPFSYTFTPLNAAGAVTFGSPNNLPPGLTLSSTGVLSGTPITASYYNFSFTINDTVDTVTVSAALDVYTVNVTSPGSIPNGTQNALYNYTFAAGGGTPPYTFNVNGLPGGLTVSQAGVLSGTANGVGRFNLNVTATDSNRTSYTKVISFDVVGVPPSLPQVQSSGSFDDCSFGVACSRGLQVNGGGTAPFVWNVSGLPVGMSTRHGSGVTSSGITDSDVELWGAPLVLGTFNIVAVVTDANGVSAAQTFKLHVSPLWVDGSDTLPNGTQGVAYSKLLRVIGGTPALSAPLYLAQAPPLELPDGLTLSGMTVSGTPAENGNFTSRLTFTDHAGSPNTLTLSEYFNIGSAGTNTISAQQLAFGNYGAANDIIGYFPVGTNLNYQLNACCASSYTWSKTGGSLPAGVSLSTGGMLTGTLTTAGTYTFVVQVADSGNLPNFGVRQYSIFVTSLYITTPQTLPYASLNTPYDTQLSSTLAANFSMLPGYYLPPGLSLSSGGVISGTPTATGQVTFYVQAVDVNTSSDVFVAQFNLAVYTTYPPLFLGIGPTVGPLSPGVQDFQLTASGGKPPYHYSLSPGAVVPPGFRVQDGGQMPNFFPTSVTGGLLGVNTGAGTYSTSLRVTDSDGNTFDRAITQIDSSLTILSPGNPPAAVFNSAYSYTFTASGGTGTYTWSAVGLPAGINIGTSTGTISGIPSASGNFYINITVTDTSGTAEPFGYNLTVYPFAITTGQVLPQGTIGASYSQTLAAPNCGSNCTWAIVGGSPPNGLSMNSAGVISGTPNGFSTNTFTVQASGSNGAAQKVFGIFVPFNPPQPLSITSNPNLYYSTVGSGYWTQLFAQGGTQPYTWSVASGSLPPGISLSSPGETLGFNFAPGFTYLIGKPTRTGNYPFTLRVTDGASNTTTQTFNWVISPLNFDMTVFPFNGPAGTYGRNTPTPTYNTAYQQQILVTGGSGNYISWTTPLAASPLPPGLTLNAATGMVSGTPTATGSYSTLVQVTDDAGNTHQQFITFNVASPTGVTVNIGIGPNLGTFASGGTYVFNLNPGGGAGPYTFTVLDSLPPGCSLETGNSLLSNSNGSYDMYCAPLGTGAYNFTLKATDSGGNIGVRVLSITFSPIQLYTTTGLANGSTGTAYSQQLLAWDYAGTVTWSIAAGSALPPGMTLNGSTLGGSPTTAGSYSFTLTAADSATSTSTNYTFTIAVSTITITNPTIIPVHGAYEVPYNYQFTATGGGTNKTWSASGLPSGLSISTTGLVTGSAEGTGNYNVAVTVSDGTSTVTKHFLLYVYYPEVLTYNPALTSMSDARLGQSYSMNLSPSGGIAPYTWTLAPGSNLPPGLTLYSGSALPPNARPGITILAGEPSTAGQYSFDLIVTDSASPAATVRSTFTLNVTPMALEAGGLPNGVTGTAYSRQLTAVGGTPPYTFAYSQNSISFPMFPPGMTASASGLISGTPTSTGNYSFYATVTDNAGHSYKTSYSLTVNNSSAASGFAIVTPPPFGLSVGIGNDIGLSTNGSSTYTWSLQAGSLPPGMTLSPDGTISGAGSAPGTFNFTIRATDNTNSGNFADCQYSVVIAPMQLNFQSGVPPVATLGVPYSYQFSMAGGTPPYTFATTPLEPLPPGLTMSSNGLLSGTPAQNGTFPVYVSVTDSHGYTGWAANEFAVVVPGQNVPPSSYPFQTHDGSVGVAYSTSSGSYSYPLDYSFEYYGVQPVTYAVAPGSALPPGMAIVQGANGVPAYLGGIPTTAGSYSYSLVATDSNGQSVTTQFTTNISPVAVSPKVLPNGAVGTAYSVALSASGGTVPYTYQLAPYSDLPPGLTFTAAGVLSGTPTVAGDFNPIVIVTDSAKPANTLTFSYTVVIDSGGQAPGIGISPAEVIQLSYVRTAPAPSPIPVNITETSGSLAFDAMVSGIPGASLSATSGTAPATLTLSLNPSGLVAGTYVGVVGVYAANAVNAVTGIPVVLTVINPPPCTYTLIPTGSTIAAAGGSGSFNVSTGSLCSWTAATSDAFVTVDPASASGTGSGTVQYSLTSNGGLSSRTGHITVGGQTYTITQFGSTCALAITPASITATYAGGLATVNVTTTNSACTWSASGLGASPTSGTGNGAVTFTIPANSSVSTQTLTAAVQLTGGSSSTFTVTQGGASCTVGLSVPSAGASYSGGTGEVDVTTLTGCSYSTVAGPSWISVTSGGAGNGPGPVALTYSVAANSTTVSRSGALSIGDKLFTITQDPTPCSVTVDASNSGSPFGSSSGSGTLAVTANGSNCTWTASSPVSWATVSPAYGSGNGAITVTATSNASSTVSRSTNLTVAGQSVAVTQGGTICNDVLGSSNASIPFGGGTGGVTVTAPGVCGWQSLADASAAWLTISSSGSGGTSNVVFTAAANGTASARSGTLTIAGQPFTVNEAAGPCNYILSGTSTTLLAGQASGLFTFSTGTAGCSATAVSFANWLTATTASSSDGTSGTVSFAATANPAGVTRSGTIQFAGQTYTVTQSAAACAFSLNAYGLALGQAGGTGSLFGSATALSCPVTPAVDQPSIVILGTLAGPVGSTYTLPFTVVSYNSTVGGVRRMVISFGGQLFTIKQTSW